MYRRYRPQKFQDVIGQEQVTRPLMNALRAERTAHAYLFSGPRGCGKTTSARILARCLNCAAGPTDTPCGECASCRELSAEGGGSLDVIEMDAASHGSVEDARSLVERASFAPARDRYKIFIVDEAHMVTKQGFNALLKLVEEPPDHVKFVFATTEPEKVIPTIRSRTHHYPFRLVPPELLEKYMAGLCVHEGMDVADGVLPLVVRAGGGSVRDSLSVLDQLMGGADGTELAYEAAIALLGYTDGALLDATIEAIAAADGAKLFGIVESLVQAGHEPRRFVEDLLQRLRDLVILGLAGEGAADVFSSAPRDRFAQMQAQAQALGPKRASLSADIVNEALGSMAGATSPRLQLELLCARLLLGTGLGGQRPAAASAGYSGSGSAATANPGADAMSASERASVQAKAAQLREAFSRKRKGEGAFSGGGATPVDASSRPSMAAPSGPSVSDSSGGPAGVPGGFLAGATGDGASVVAEGGPRDGAGSWPEAPASSRAFASTGATGRATGAIAGSGAGADAGGAQESPAHARAAAQEAPARTRPSGPETPGTGGADVRSRWGEVLDHLERVLHARSSRMFLEQFAEVGNVEGNILNLHFPQGNMVQAAARHAGTAAEAVAAVLGLNVTIACVPGGAPDPKAEAAWEAASSGMPSGPDSSEEQGGTSDSGQVLPGRGLSANEPLVDAGLTPPGPGDEWGYPDPSFVGAAQASQPADAWGEPPMRGPEEGENAAGRAGAQAPPPPPEDPWGNPPGPTDADPWGNPPAPTGGTASPPPGAASSGAARTAASEGQPQSAPSSLSVAFEGLRKRRNAETDEASDVGAPAGEAETEPRLPESMRDEDGAYLVSESDIGIEDSRVVGLNAVLDFFGGKVIEEIECTTKGGR